MEIRKATKIGLCFGIRRALGMLDRVLQEQGGAETLGAIAHNQYLVEKLAGKGVRIARDIDDTRGNSIVISSHGVGPQVIEELKRRDIRIVDTTCPFVHRAQLAAQRLASAGFDVIIYGDANHTEVRGILGWSGGRGMATLDAGAIARPLSRRVGILSQTTQIPAGFTDFVRQVIGRALVKDSELRIADTICHDTRERQDAALKLAGGVDLLYVIGSRNSANTNRLVELCSGLTHTYLLESAADVNPQQLHGCRSAGITAGASTPEEVIDMIVAKLEDLATKTSV